MILEKQDLVYNYEKYNRLTLIIKILEAESNNLKCFNNNTIIIVYLSCVIIVFAIVHVHIIHIELLNDFNDSLSPEGPTGGSC